MKETEHEQIIGQIEALLTQLKHSLSVSGSVLSSRDKKSKQTLRQKGGFSGLTGKIHELIGEGFFKKPKTISEIQKKLKDEGVRKPTTSLMPSLILLVRKRILSRNKPPKGIYKYFQRN